MRGKTKPLSNDELNEFDILWEKYPNKIDKEYITSNPIRLRNIIKNSINIEIAICNYTEYINSKHINLRKFASGKRFFLSVYKDYIKKKEDKVKIAYDRKKYENYISKSEVWKTIRRLRIEVDEYRCKSCRGTNNLQVHHKTYENLYNENLRDLITLCEKCHKNVHMKEG